MRLLNVPIWSRRDLVGGLAAGAVTPASLSRFRAGPAETNVRDVIASLRAQIADHLAEGRMVGCACALVGQDAILWEEGFGWADKLTERRATAHTPFSIASTTKPITTYAAMTLVEAGKLSLDASANAYLGEYKIRDATGPANAVTVRQLANHSSGLPTFFEMYDEGVGCPSIDEIIRDYGHIVCPPGERYEYSNLGMAILADIVGRRSGDGFERYLRRAVFDRLGMANSFLSTEPGRRADMATRYADVNPLPFYLTATPGSGEVYSSAHDLALFALSHMRSTGRRDRRTLGDESLATLHAPSTPIAAPNYFYGLGWQILKRPDQPTVLYHGGGQSGVACEFVLIPDRSVAAVILCNSRTDRAALEALRDRLIRSQIPDWAGIPAPPPPRIGTLDSGYTGVWAGELFAGGRPTSVKLAISESGDAQFTLGDAEPRPVQDLSLVDGLLSGGTSGSIASADVDREKLTDLSLNLKRRGSELDGEIIAWAKSDKRMAILPHWTTLTLQ